MNITNAFTDEITKRLIIIADLIIITIFVPLSMHVITIQNDNNE